MPMAMGLWLFPPPVQSGQNPFAFTHTGRFGCGSPTFQSIRMSQASAWVMVPSWQRYGPGE